MWPSCELAAPEAIDASRSLFEPPPPSRLALVSEPAPRTHGAALAALAGTLLAQRFCSWTGLSGRAYVFSVYRPTNCPAFCNAILLTAARADAGRLRVLSVRDTGAFPEPVMARAQRELRALGAGHEFHLHLLASCPADRAAAVADLSGRADPEPAQLIENT